MKTEIVDVTDLEEGNQVKLFGSTYEVTSLTGKWANERDLVLDETEGASRLNLYDVESTPFVRVVPDPEEFRVHSTVDPEFYIGFFEKNGHLVVDMYNPFSGYHSVTVDKADLKAVVEKL